MLSTMMSTALVLGLASTALGHGHGAAEADYGYTQLFTTANETHEMACYPAANLPKSLVGSFIIPSVAQFEVGEQQFQGILDGFGKVQRFVLRGDNGTVCFHARMMDTEFYNKSIAAQSVWNVFLFMETKPPINGSNIGKAVNVNDNVFVNTVALQGRADDKDVFEYVMLTDMPVRLPIDMDTLKMGKLMKFKDIQGTGQVQLGSAHPIWHDGCSYDVEPVEGMLGTHVMMYKLCNTTDVRDVITRFKTPYLPYLHSWGMSENWAVFPLQPWFLDFKLMVLDNTVVTKSMVEVNQPNATIYLVPYNKQDKTPVEFQIPNFKFYFTHFVNTFENDTGVVFDACTFNHNPFMDTGPAAIPNEFNRTLRNQFERVPVMRFVLHLQGSQQGQVTYETLSVPGTATDFPRFNDRFRTKEYCYYYANEWFHDQVNYGSMAIVKQNVCGGDEKPLYWYKAGYFPSEPTFIDNGGDEDNGVLVFTAMNGLTNQSYLEVLDAKTMTTIEEVLIPGRITFTTHGSFFPNLL